MGEERRITMRLTRIENTLEEIKRTLNEPEPPDRLITVNEAAEILHCTPQRVRDSIHEGALNATRKGRRYFLSFHDVRRRTGYGIIEKNGRYDSHVVKRHSHDQ